MWAFKLKASALQLTLYITLVIALLLSAFILLVHTHKRFKAQNRFIIETIQNADKGIQYALKNSIQLNDTTPVHLNDEPFKNLKVYRTYWGVFEKVTAVSKIKKNKISKVALVGGFKSKTESVALYAQENNRPLVLAGNTKIEGTAYLPKQGVKFGTIAGQSYYRNQLIYGPQKESSDLPQLFNESLKQLSTLAKQVQSNPESQFINIDAGKTYTNSFLKPTQVVFSNATITLSNMRLTGNIIIQSLSKIIVEASSVLKDVILIAPMIELKNNIKGTLQAIASEELLVRPNVTLDYPSALILNEKPSALPKTSTFKPNAKSNSLFVSAQSTINGLVLYLGQPNLNNFNVQLELNKNSTVIGEVYCNLNLELKGTVHGSVYAKNFIAKQSGAVYQNYIFNATIIANKLPPEYVGLRYKKNKKGIVKWLY